MLVNVQCDINYLRRPHSHILHILIYKMHSNIKQKTPGIYIYKTTAKETLHPFLLDSGSCNNTTKYHKTDLKKEKLTLTTWEGKKKKSSVQSYNMTLLTCIAAVSEYFPEIKVTLHTGELFNLYLCAFTLL